MRMWLLGTILISMIAIGAFYWKSAKDEIFYLCGNFSAGVSKSSVTQQLATANLSRYKETGNGDGSMIVFSSRLYIVPHSCTIKFDRNGQVVVATFE